jgi:AmpE protein
MAFLLILASLLIVRFSSPGLTSFTVNWARNWYQQIEQSSSLSPLGSLRLYIVLAVPVLLLTGLIVLLHGAGLSFLGHVLALLVLLYSFGGTDFLEATDKYVADLKRDDVQGAFHDAESILNASGEAANWQDLHQATLSSIGWKYFQCYFPCLFWFVVVGAPGALLYRLMTQIIASAERESDVSRLKTMLRVLEWLPLRLCGLTLAFVGRWEPTFRQFLDSLSRLSMPSALVFVGYINAALNGVPSAAEIDNTDAEVGELEELPQLIDRALVMWLAVVGLIAVF